MKRHARRPGIALLEVIAATAILGFSVLGWFSLVSQLQHSLTDALARESRVQRASSALALASTMPAESLDAWRSGRRFGDLRIDVHSTAAGLYEISVADTVERSVLLATAVRARASATPDAQ